MSAPQTSGSSAATRLRKTQSASRNRSGNASSSAWVRSCSTWSLTCVIAIAGPPTATPGMGRSRSRHPLRRERPRVLGDGRARVGRDDRLASVAREQRLRRARETRARRGGRTGPGARARLSGGGRGRAPAGRRTAPRPARPPSGRGCFRCRPRRTRSPRGRAGAGSPSRTQRRPRRRPRRREAPGEAPGRRGRRTPRSRNHAAPFTCLPAGKKGLAAHREGGIRGDRQPGEQDLRTARTARRGASEAGAEARPPLSRLWLRRHRVERRDPLPDVRRRGVGFRRVAPVFVLI